MSAAPAGVALGVDVGGTKMLALAVSDEGEVLARARRPTPKLDAKALGAGVLSLVDELDDAVGAGAPLGVGLPGMVGRDGTLAFSPHLRFAEGLDLVGIAAHVLPGRSVRVANDANCALLAEAELGVARGAEHVVMITLGTGIGGAALIDGELLRGSLGFAGEVGHMVVEVEGPPCPCGQRGCWERFASGSGLGRLAREAAQGDRLRVLTKSLGGDPDSVRGEDVTAAAAAGDPEALAVVDEVGWWLARGIANLICVLDPDCVVVGGGLSAAAVLLLPAAQRHLGSLLEEAARRPSPPLRAATFGADAGAIGASLLGRGAR